MSKEQSLEQEVRMYVEFAVCGVQETTEGVQDYYAKRAAWIDQETDNILKAIDSRLPKEPNSDTTAHLEINQIDDWELGYHQALSDVRKELGL